MARIIDFTDGVTSNVTPEETTLPAVNVGVTPAGSISSTNAQAALEEVSSDVDALYDQKGEANGIATLDAQGKIPLTQIPATAITSVFVVADIAARDLLEVEMGDVAKVLDDGSGNVATYIYTGTTWEILESDAALQIHADDTSTHGVAGDIVGTSDAQTLSNKDFDGGTASNTSRLTVPKNTKSNLDSLTRKEATIVYATDEAKAYIDNGSTLIPVGSGSGGGLNYIENGDAELASPAPSLYSDSGSSPTDGSGGSVNTSTELNFSRSTSSPLRGSASWVFDKKSGNQQGKGGSFPFTIDVADKGKQVQITFDYSVLSGTYATGDVAVYVVHDPSGTPKVIQPSAFNIENVGIESLARLTFQTEYSSVLDYNLCFHVASTSASTYSLKFDNITLGPQVVPMGAPVIDAVAKTTSGSWASPTTTYTMYETQVGDTAHYRVRLALSGAPTSATLTVNLPAGRVIDTTKITGTTAPYLGSGVIRDNDTTNRYNVNVQYSSTTSVFLQAILPASGSTHATVTVDQANPITFAASDSIDFTFSVPIVGWSSSTVVSSSADTRAVYVTANAPNAGTHTTETILAFTEVSDSHGAFSTNTFTAPVPGLYQFDVGALTNSFASSSIGLLQLAYKVGGGSSVRFAWTTTNGQTTNFWVGGSSSVYLKAGETLAFYSTSSTSCSYAQGVMSIRLLQGPSQIAASEIVSMVCYKNTGSHTSTGNFQDVASWNAVTQDTHGGFNTTTGVYTCPAPGTYVVRSKVAYTTNSTGIRQLQIMRDGSALSYSPDITGAVSSAVQGYTVIPNCVAGTLIKVQAYQNSGGNLAYSTAANFTELSIHRLGGV